MHELFALFLIIAILPSSKKPCMMAAMKQSTSNVVRYDGAIEFLNVKKNTGVKIRRPEEILKKSEGSMSYLFQNNKGAVAIMVPSMM